MWTDTDVLYALFILKANNHLWKKWINHPDMSDRVFCDCAALYYADLFADRAVTEEEFEGWVPVHPWMAR